MKKILAIFLTGTLLAIGGLTYAAPSSIVSAAGKDDACAGLAATGGSCTASATGPTVESVIKTGLNIFSWIVGIIAVIMVIVGGFQYVTSAGESGKITSAKNTITYALVGIVIVALSQVIVQFVLAKATAPPAPTPPAPTAPTT